MLDVEDLSIEYVPVSKRYGNPLSQAPFWFVGNFNFFTVAIGFIGPALGLSFGYTCLSSIVGILFGTVFMALHASQGPELGLPQMIQSRPQFGYRGVILPLGGTLLTFLIFNVLDCALVGQGLAHLMGWNSWLIMLAISAVAVALAVAGYNLIHLTFRVLFWVSLPFYIAISIGVLTGSVSPHSSVSSPFSWVAFAAQFTAGASYNITFAPYVSDYTRYLPATASRSTLISSVYIGASGSAIWLIVLGAWLATYLGSSDGMIAINLAGNQIYSGLGTATVFVSILALVAAMALNAYSGMLTILTGIDSFKSLRPSKIGRTFVILGLAVVWMICSSFIDEGAISQLYNGLAIMLFVLIPWTGINLVDYFLIRKMQYAIPDIVKPGGLYSNWAWRGLLSYVVGPVCGIPFVFLPGLFEGPIGTRIGGVDISWLPELVASSGAYYLFARSLKTDERFTLSS